MSLLLFVVADLVKLAPLARALLFAGVAACGALIPGPCTFDPKREFDCSLGDPCQRNFACADDGFCKSADVACLDGETRCEYPERARVAICVKDEDFQTSKTHCNTCFHTCRGASACVDGICQDEPPEGRCVTARGNADCRAGQRCVGDGDGDETNDGHCEDGGAGDGGALDACDKNDDCAAGLCKDGQCATTCDVGCVFGAHCEEDAVPGGLCVPDDGEVCR